MNRDAFNLIKELLDELKSRLISELTYASCPICGNTVYTPGVWEYGHTPYYSLESGKIKVGYRCPKSENPIIVYDISLKDIITEWKETSTKYLE